MPVRLGDGGMEAARASPVPAAAGSGASTAAAAAVCAALEEGGESVQEALESRSGDRRRGRMAELRPELAMEAVGAACEAAADASLKAAQRSAPVRSEHEAAASEGRRCVQTLASSPTVTTQPEAGRMMTCRGARTACRQCDLQHPQPHAGRSTHAPL